MGSYSAPSQRWIYEKATVDLNTPTNAVVLGPFRCGNFLAVISSVNGFDGSVRVEILDTTGLWTACGCDVSSVEQTVNIAGGDLRIQNTVFIAEYPYQVRIV